jgi:hypothetical protein
LEPQIVFMVEMIEDFRKIAGGDFNEKYENRSN